MKKIGVVCYSKHHFNIFLEELGCVKKEERTIFKPIIKIDDIMGVEFISVIRCYPYSNNWNSNLDDLFEHAKGRIR